MKYLLPATTTPGVGRRGGVRGRDMRVADTSAVYAFFVTDDSHHAQARAAFAEGSPIMVPAEILAETLLLLERRVGFQAARAAGEPLRTVSHVEVHPAGNAPWDNILGAAWQECGAASGRITYADAVVVAWCKRRSLVPLTFDKRLTRAAGKTG